MMINGMHYNPDCSCKNCKMVTNHMKKSKEAPCCEKCECFHCELKYGENKHHNENCPCHKQEVPAGDCVYGCEGNKHFCGRYPNQEEVKECTNTIACNHKSIEEENECVGSLGHRIDRGELSAFTPEKGWEELREKLADIEHQRWADWQKYLHSKLEKFGFPNFPNKEGNYDRIMKANDFLHWERQIRTDYKDLTEREKDSDRKEVDKYLPLLKDFIRQELASQREEWEKEPHNTKDGYCCACEYDIAGFDGRVKQASQELLKELKR